MNDDHLTSEPEVVEGADPDRVADMLRGKTPHMGTKFLKTRGIQTVDFWPLKLMMDDAGHLYCCGEIDGHRYDVAVVRKAERVVVPPGVEARWVDSASTLLRSVYHLFVLQPDGTLDPEKQLALTAEQELDRARREFSGKLLANQEVIKMRRKVVEKEIARGLSYEAIAEKHDWPLSTVKSDVICIKRDAKVDIHEPGLEVPDDITPANARKGRPLRPKWERKKTKKRKGKK